LRDVADHFSRPEQVEAMDRKRVDLGLREWEEYVIRKHFRAHGRILDIGCGCGREAIPLARKGYEVVAVDVSEAQLKRAEENAIGAGVDVSFQTTDGVNLPEGSFDAIVLWAQVLGNIESREHQLKLLASCREALSDTGILSASGHNGRFCRKDTPQHTDEDWLYPWGKGELKYHLFTVEAFQSLFTDSGFTVLETQIPDSLPAIIHAVACRQ